MNYCRTMSSRVHVNTRTHSFTVEPRIVNYVNIVNAFTITTHTHRHIFICMLYTHYYRHFQMHIVACICTSTIHYMCEPNVFVLHDASPLLEPLFCFSPESVRPEKTIMNYVIYCGISNNEPFLNVSLMVMFSVAAMNGNAPMAMSNITITAHTNTQTMTTILRNSRINEKMGDGKSLQMDFICI